MILVAAAVSAVCLCSTAKTAVDATVAKEDAVSATIGSKSCGDSARTGCTTYRVINIPNKARISLDRADATYRCGEEATFSVSIAETNGAKIAKGIVEWQLDNYGTHVFAKGNVDLAKESEFTVKGTLPYPGFLRLTVRSGKGVRYFRRSYSAAFEPEKIRTGLPKPADFDSFWDGAVARLEREVPIDVKIEPIPELSKGGFSVNRISFATFGGRVYGMLSYPTDSSKGPYPAHVHCPGAGPGWLAKNQGGSRGAVILNMSVHGFRVPDDEAERKALYDAQEAKYRKVHGPSSSRAYPVGGMTVGREAAHFFPVILGVNRAVNWLASRPDVDKRHIMYSGASQGGGFGLYLAGLNRNITKAYMGVPALADLMGRKMDGRQSGWPRVIEFETQKDPARLAMLEKVAPYFDGAYFAERITIPVRLSVGYADESCAPQAVLAAYNAIPSKDKKLYHGIGGVHGSPNSPSKEVNDWLAK
jgi:cephalosporin-C deacetylase-like acetyl esterase